MNKNKKFSLKDRITSFKYAFQGLSTLLKNEHNARIHVIMAFIVLLASWFFQLSKMEWVAVLLCIGFVFSMELLNSALEALADRLSEEQDELIGKAKDMGAAAVLIAALVSAIVGGVIFAPKIFF